MYTNELDPDLQITTEENIAAMIFNYSPEWEDNLLEENDCNELAKQILHFVLEKFRPDLVVSE